MISAKIIEDIVMGRLTPGEVHWMARWGSLGMRHADIERVAVALDEVGRVRYLGGGGIEMLEVDGVGVGDPEAAEGQLCPD